MSSVRDQLQPDEEIVYTAHPTQLVLLPPLILTLVIVGGAGVIWYQTGLTAVLVGGGILAVLSACWLLVKLVVLRSNEFVVTSRRIIKQTGVLDKRSTDTYLDKINNVDHTQTIWGRILGYGTVEVDTASESGTTSFSMVAKPLPFKQAILATAQRYRTAPVAAAPLSGAGRIRELKALLDDGLISREEYEEKRRKALEEL